MRSAATVSGSKRSPSGSASTEQSSRKIRKNRSGEFSSPRARKSASRVGRYRYPVQKRAFENENVMIGGATESEENPFEAIFDQNQSKIGVALPSDARLPRTEAEMFLALEFSHSESRKLLREGRQTRARRRHFSSRPSTCAKWYSGS